MWTVLGLVALVIGMKVDHHLWRRLVTPALFVSFALMVAVLVPGIGVKVNGARAWIALGPFSIQPVELLKLALLVYCADLLARRADRMAEVRSTFFPLLTVLAGAAFLTLMQPDLGGLIVVASIVLSVAFIAGTPVIPFASITAAVAAVGAGFVMTHRRDRWLAFTDLARYKESEGWQVWQSLIGIASGGITGAGLGASKAKWGYLPEAHTDFIFAIIGEELGFVGAVVVCLLFFLFAVIGVQVALRAPDRYGMLLAGGITAWVCVQAIINIGGVVGIMPLTGLTLPFVSFGGSSLLVMLAAAGILLNIARQSP
jgi:cell division protein FtsW